MTTKTKMLTIKATLEREYEVEGPDYTEEDRVTTAGLLAEEVAQMADDELADEMKFEIEGSEKVEGRDAREVAEEWQGVCSEQMDNAALIDALCVFIDKNNLTSKLDDFLRKLAEEGMSDPAAE